MKRNSSIQKMGLLAAGIVPLVAGCSNNPYSPGETAQSVLYGTMGEDPKTLDPSVSYVVSEAKITDLIYPSYFQYNFLKRKPITVELALGAVEPLRERKNVTVMEKGKPVKKQGEEWTFTLKRGLRFQDDPCFPGGKGREITAKDVIFSFRRMADPSVGCPVLGFFIDKIVGFDAYAKNNQELQTKGKPADYTAPVEGLQLDPKDPYTFRILLNQPYPQLRFLMTMHFTTPIPHEAVEKYGKDFARHPVGCGPYRMTEYVSKQRIVLEANPNRRPEFYPTEGDPGDREAGLLKDAGKRLPLTDKIVFTTLKETVTGWNLFLQGYLDRWGVSQENFSQVIGRQGELTPEMKRKGIEMFYTSVPQISYFAFNMSDPVVGGYTPQKRKLRQAISTAIDSQAFIDLFSQGIGQPADFLLPPGLFGYDAKFRNPYRQYNVEHAKQLLKEAGYPNGIDPKSGDHLTLYFDNTASSAAGRQLVGLVTKQLDAIGVRVESRTALPNVWQDHVDHGQFQFIYYGWLADYPDPENFVFLLYGPNLRPGPNSSGYNSPEYNKLFEQMRSMDDGPQRLAILNRMRTVAVEDCPWVFLQHDKDIGLYYDWLRNTKSHPVANDTTKYASVDGAARARMQLAWNQPNYWPIAGFAALLMLGTLPAISTVQRRRNRRLRRG